MNHRVVITGFGPVSSIGIGREEFIQGVQQGKPKNRSVEWLAGTRLEGLEYSPIESFAVSDYLPGKLRKSAKLMSRDIQLAVTSSILAMQEAGLMYEAVHDRARWGCISGAGFVSVEQAELAPAFLDCSSTEQSALKRWGERSLNLLPPLMVLKYLPNMIGSHITIIHRLQGISNTLTCGEVSGHLAIGEAFNAIRRGTCDVVVCGGSESRINPSDLIYEVAKGSIQVPNRQGQSVVVPSEGAGFLVLENLELARQRKAPILAEVTGFAVRQSTQNEQSAAVSLIHASGMSRAISAALRAAHVTADELSAVLTSHSRPIEERCLNTKDLREIFNLSSDIPLLNARRLLGDCYAGNSLDVGLAAFLIGGVIDAKQLPPGIFSAGNPSCMGDDARFILATSNNAEGQNVAIILSRLQ